MDCPLPAKRRIHGSAQEYLDGFAATGALGRRGWPRSKDDVRSMVFLPGGEEAHSGLQLVGLSRQLLGCRGHLFCGRGVLLGHLIQLLDGHASTAAQYLPPSDEISTMQQFASERWLASPRDTEGGDGERTRENIPKVMAQIYCDGNKSGRSPLPEPTQAGGPRQ